MTENQFQTIENKSHAIKINDPHANRFFVSESMFKLEELIEGIQCKLINMSLNDFKNQENINKRWLEDGVDVEILKIGALGWQTGKLKIKVSLEFCPEEEINSDSENY
jgi:hypothetical protein